MKLQENEIKQFFDIVNDYQRVWEEIANAEEQIKILLSKQKQLKEDLEDNRKKEKTFTESILRKYGKGKFNLETLEYELIL